MKNIIRKFIEQSPFLASLYRTLRDELQFIRSKPHKTKPGFKFLYNPAMRKGDHEPEVTKLILQLLKKTEIFLDIGANMGYYTCLARSKKRSVIAVEPLQQNLKYLYANLKLNKWNDIEVYPVGLSLKPGITEIFGSGTGASLIKGWAGTSTKYSTWIPVSTLDNIIGNRFMKKKLLIKIDVEGAEYMALKGASRILKMSPKPSWIMEICLAEHHSKGLNPHFLQIFDLFWENGYEAWAIDKNSKKVSKNDVKRWTKNRSRDFGTHNYYFKPKTKS